MITPMTKYSFIFLSSEKEGFIGKLQELGLMDIVRSDKPVDETSAALLKEAEALKAVLPSAKAESERISKEIKAAMAEEEALKPWGGFDPKAVEGLAGMGLSMHWYTCSRKVFDPTWKEEYPIVVVSEEPEVRFVAVLPSGEDNPLPIKEIPAPSCSASEVAEKIAGLQASLEENDRKVASLEAQAEVYESRYRSAMAGLDRYLASVAACPAAENTIQTLVGYAPTENDAAVTGCLDKLDVLYLKEAATPSDNPPIKLKNNRFVRSFEMLTDMYGRPVYDEFDPTPFLSIFFLLFFAMCMGDAGYGLLLIIIGQVLKKVRGMEDISPLVTILGVGTLVVGFVMHTFFGVDIAALSWIPEWMKKCMITGNIAGFDAQMVLSIIIGIVHLSLAMIVKTVYSTKRKGFLGSLGTWGWTLLIVGGVATGGLALAGVIGSAVTKWIIIGLGVISALGIFLFNDINRSPLKNIGAGLWETYNTATGLLGDVLSYLRLYALGLAGGMLGQAFNNIASMTIGDGGFGFGWIPFILILLVGHALNLAMCCLGAFVHPLRLNFLEFFKNSGYEGKGRIYRPINK